LIPYAMDPMPYASLVPHPIDVLVIALSPESLNTELHRIQPFF
jgi:hypothetical protein